MTKQLIDTRVDELATTNAQIAALQARAKALKAQLLDEHGAGKVYGLRYSASLVVTEDSESISYRRVAGYLGSSVTAQIFSNAIKRATSTRKGSLRVTVCDIDTKA